MVLNLWSHEICHVNVTWTKSVENTGLPKLAMLANVSHKSVTVGLRLTILLKRFTPMPVWVGVVNQGAGI